MNYSTCKKICNNCNMSGHTYKMCKRPITSYGIICYRLVDNTPYFLLVQRKDSYSFCEFSKVRYNIHNKEYIIFMLENMTKEEQIFLYNIDKIEYIYIRLWGGSYKKYSYNKKIKTLQKLLNGVEDKDKNIFTLKSLIKDIHVSRKTPEWGFPKGRKYTNESYKECAIREFSEETCIPKNIINMFPYKSLEETFTSPNKVSYKHIYYIASVNNTYIPNYNFQKSEIGNIKWCSLQEAFTKIEYKNTDRIKILQNVYNIIS